MEQWNSQGPYRILHRVKVNIRIPKECKANIQIRAGGSLVQMRWIDLGQLAQLLNSRKLSI